VIASFLNGATRYGSNARRLIEFRAICFAKNSIRKDILLIGKHCLAIVFHSGSPLFEF
jgi:hypothetical protein